jgi:2'-deoxynucleoside 5'-phosphate N-hydrolase
MKIYFGFTVAGDRSAIETARSVVQLLEQAGHEVLTRHLVRDDARDADRRLAPQEIYQRDMNWLCECDLFIAEVSGSSFGIGYEAGYVLGTSSKQVVLLYRREVEKSISLLITGNTHPNCTLVPYRDALEVESFIEEGLKRGFAPITSQPPGS